ncbi:sugar ABC transporter permease [Lacrimispora amygdalina]|jgi:oligogalacturonide transport system permease protein|uniref:Oligogalacturonide ABC transporter membrane protein n=2 Tax=Lacrimispora TaxID=2719231 RepID=A0A2S6HSU9_9FIRM|nr:MULTISPECIES: carbohydrate ABC transporter permease [Clostridiaceae]MBE5990667.1 carbohydrate ABC transporter permease [Paenibacillaceae bacterium]PPK80826.1 oligogalacturonide ABC transporter membrane protein [Hungatella xylanolytica]RFZ78573.1 carbohydrate ABC transporter permease [Clostridium indicum]
MNGLSKLERRRRRRNLISALIRYGILTAVALVMIYPILWLVGATFKTNNEIFTTVNFIPKRIDFTPYIEGWKTRTQFTFTTFFLNTFQYVIPKILFCLVSSTLVAYGFARFQFPFKKFFFSLLMATMFLPAVVTRIPLYLLWKNLGLLDTYVPLIAPTIFANEPFFVFMLIQFLRSIPTYLDEAATVDGCNSFEILIRILLPALKPAIVSCTIFQFIWSFNDFLGPLIYVTSLSKYPVALALKMSIDQSSGIVEWNQILAMSFLALLPALILFFAAQKYFVEGITSTGAKG